MMAGRAVLFVALFLMTFGLLAPRSVEAATVSWCLGQVNNSKILPTSACPIVTATDDSGNLEVFVTTQGDVQLEEFGFEWASDIDADDITQVTIYGEGVGTSTSGSLSWSAPQFDVQMDGFGNFDVFFNVEGQGSNDGINGTGFGFSGGGTIGTLEAALYFVIVGGSVDGFEAIFSPNCNGVSGCLQAAKVSSEQFDEFIRGGGYVSNVPLPGAVWLFLGALGSLCAFSRRKRRVIA
jgi:hypothetical protein